MTKRADSEQISNIIKSAKSIAVFGHVSPDGDCFGSAWGMKLALESLGKKVFSYLPDEIPENLSFLKNYGRVQAQDCFVPADFVVVLDSSNVKRVEKHELLHQYREDGALICLIDHHTAGDLIGFSDIVWQDTDKSSTSEMVLDILKNMNVHFDKDIATLLLTGIETDTSSFQNQNTKAQTFEDAAFLMSKGARMPQIVNNTFHAKDIDTVRLYGLVLEKLVFNEKYRTVTGYLTQEDICKLGIKGDVSAGVANYLNTIEGAKMVIFITETEDGYLKVSLRTRDENVDVSVLARAFGGGGHVKASGFTVKGSFAQDGQPKVV